MFRTFLGNTIAYLEKKLEEAEKSDYVEKPLSWALYQTWKWVDAQEKPRARKSATKPMKGARDKESRDCEAE